MNNGKNEMEQEDKNPCETDNLVTKFEKCFDLGIGSFKAVSMC